MQASWTRDPDDDYGVVSSFSVSLYLPGYEVRSSTWPHTSCHDTLTQPPSNTANKLQTGPTKP